jgi:hypothetical protein
MQASDVESIPPLSLKAEHASGSSLYVYTYLLGLVSLSRMLVCWCIRDAAQRFLLIVLMHHFLTRSVEGEIGHFNLVPTAVISLSMMAANCLPLHHPLGDDAHVVEDCLDVVDMEQSDDIHLYSLNYTVPHLLYNLHFDASQCSYTLSGIINPHDLAPPVSNYHLRLRSSNLFLNLRLQVLRLLRARPPVLDFAIAPNQKLLKVPLDALQSHQPGLLVLEPLKRRLRIAAVDVDFAEHGERHAVVELAEFLDVVVACGEGESQRRVEIRGGLRRETYCLGPGHRIGCMGSR